MHQHCDRLGGTGAFFQGLRVREIPKCRFLPRSCSLSEPILYRRASFLGDYWASLGGQDAASFLARLQAAGPVDAQDHLIRYRLGPDRVTLSTKHRCDLRQVLQQVTSAGSGPTSAPRVGLTLWLRYKPKMTPYQVFNPPYSRSASQPS